MMCADQMLNVAIKESEKLDVKVNLPLVSIKEYEKLEGKFTYSSHSPLKPMPPPHPYILKAEKVAVMAIVANKNWRKKCVNLDKTKIASC